MSKKKRNVRADFRKNRTPRARDKNWTHEVDPEADETADLATRQSAQRLFFAPAQFHHGLYERRESPRGWDAKS